MSRPLRIEYENAVYHVMNRGRGRAVIFHNDTFSALFLQCLQEASQQFGLEILAYCLMSNHIRHAIFCSQGETLCDPRE